MALLWSPLIFVRQSLRQLCPLILSRGRLPHHCFHGA